MAKFLKNLISFELLFVCGRAPFTTFLMAIIIVPTYILFKRPVYSFVEQMNSNASKNDTPLEIVAIEIPNGLPIAEAPKISSHYGNRIDPFTHQVGFHTGIDFSAKPGTMILATAAGKVKRTGLDWKGNGLFIEIEHDNGYSSLYAHMKRLNFITGERIAKNQILGEVGISDRSTGPHLHYEVAYKGMSVNPVQFLKAQQNKPENLLNQQGKYKEVLVIRDKEFRYETIRVK